MNSDDEFDAEYCEGAKVIDGLNFRELLETGSTNFTMEDLEEEEYDSSGRGKKERMQDELDGVKTLEDPFFQVYSSTKFNGVDVDGNPDFSDFDTSYDPIEKVMEAINIPNEGWTGGIKKLIIKPGLGDQIQPGQIAYINYFVFVEGEIQPVDSNTTHETRGRVGQPYRFKVGAGNVLPVLDFGVETMQPREVAKFLAEPKYAYGDLGCPPRIPRKVRALVTIELLSVVEGSQTTNLFDLDRNERMGLPFEELYKGVNEWKDSGNNAYKMEEYDLAKKKYKTALRILQDIISPKDKENKLKIEMMYTLNVNIAQCNIQAKTFKSAKRYCKIAVELPLPVEKKLKAYFRLAKITDELGDVHSSKKYIDQAKSLSPVHKDVVELYNKINNRIMKDEETEKEYAKNMFEKLSLD